ncbi:MAG TPA: ADP-ribose pyrophosphatase, partial [Acetivibrio sp.]|nr:ADP-ribose pyrophosphatase [Acetivibrio sp.]
MLGGNIVNKQGLTEEQFLTAYDASKFDRPSVTVDMLV